MKTVHKDQSVKQTFCVRYERF